MRIRIGCTVCAQPQISQAAYPNSRNYASTASVKTLRTQDTSDPRHFGTGAEVSIRHFGTSAELSGHFGTSAEMSWDTSALRKIILHCAIYKVDGELGLYSTVIG